jgi:osmoprotectant transport system substrate-binding protein
MGRLRIGAATSLVVCGLAAPWACTTDEPAARGAFGTLVDDVVTVGSFDFAESVLLAEIYSQALERRGIEVERAFALGPREFVAPAVAVGLVELVPEYSGSAATFLSRGEEIPPDDPVASHQLLVAGLEPHPVEALAAAPAENANAFVVTAVTAERHGLRSLSDLAAVAGELVFGGPPECSRRALCLVGLAAEYGIEFETIVSLDAGGPLTEQALRDGGIDVALMFSSDSAMAGDDFVELVDDRGLQPAENITPIVREELRQRWGDLVVTTIDAVSARLTTNELRGLNAAFEVHTADPAPIATAWLDRMELP